MVKTMVKKDAVEYARADETAPYDSASSFSRLTFGYVAPLIKLGRIRPLMIEDLPKVAARDEPRAVLCRLEQSWADETARRPEEPSLLRITRRLFALAVNVS